MIIIYISQKDYITSESEFLRLLDKNLIDINKELLYMYSRRQ